MQFLKQTSFVSKVRLSTQEYQEALIVLTVFLLPWVEQNDEHADDHEHWMWVIFKHCWTRPLYSLHLHNMYSIFPNNTGKPWLAQELLTKHRNSIRDHVAFLSSRPNHYIEYNNKLEERVKAYKGSNHNGKGLSPEQNMTLAWCRACDWALNHLPVTKDERDKIKSSTKRSRSSRAKRGSSLGDGESLRASMPVCVCLLAADDSNGCLSHAAIHCLCP